MQWHRRLHQAANRKFVGVGCKEGTVAVFVRTGPSHMRMKFGCKFHTNGRVHKVELVRNTLYVSVGATFSQYRLSSSGKVTGGVGFERARVCACVCVLVAVR